MRALVAGVRKDGSLWAAKYANTPEEVVEVDMSIMTAVPSVRPEPGEMWEFSLRELLVVNVATKGLEHGSRINGTIDGIVLSCKEKTYADGWTEFTVTFMNDRGIFEARGDAYTEWGRKSS